MPKGLREQVSFVADTFDPCDSDLSLCQFLLKKCDGIDAVAVLLDEDCKHEAEHIRNALFIGVVHFPDYMPSVQNFLSGILAKLLRNLGHLLFQLKDSTSFQSAILPLRNFISPELGALSLICEQQALEGEFSHNMLPPLRGLIARRGPKRRSKYPTRYFRDDRNMFFEYGHEEHSRFDTGGSHLISCQINGLFRFGKRLEESRHFNVTQGDADKSLFSVSFSNCHDEPHEVVRRTHVNMFSNDFHK